MKYKFLIAISVSLLPNYTFAGLQVDVNSEPGTICFSEQNQNPGAYPYRVVLCGPVDMYGDDLSYYGDGACDSDLTLGEFEVDSCYLGVRDGYVVFCDGVGEGEITCDYCDIPNKGEVISDWGELGNNIVGRTLCGDVGGDDVFASENNWTCDVDFTAEYEYGCAAGYYQSAGTGASMTCTRCPSSGGVYGTNSVGTTAITSCYMPSGSSFSETSGSGTYIGNCYYVN